VNHNSGTSKVWGPPTKPVIFLVDDEAMLVWYVKKLSDTPNVFKIYIN